MIKCIYYLLPLLFINTTYAADWFFLKQYEKNELYVDRDSIEDLKNSAKKVSFRLTPIEKDGGFSRFTAIMRCKYNTSTTLAVRVYSPRYPNHEINMEIEEDKQTTDPIERSPHYTEVFKYVCTK